MKIAVLSDSHKKSEFTKIAIEYLKSQGATYLIHAGDLEIYENLEILKNSSLVYIAVFGNNDNALLKYQDQFNIKQEPYYFKIKNVKFKLMHLPFYMSSDSDIVISGHTHCFEHSYTNGTLYLNPGEICARNKPQSECVMLEIKEDKYIINYYHRDLIKNIWESQEYIYEK